VRAEWTALQFTAHSTRVDLCTVDLSAVFLDVAKDRLTRSLPVTRAPLGADVLWQALHDLTLAVSPALVFTAEEVWHTHPGLTAECESVHFAEWPKRAEANRTSDEWMFLREVRDTVNTALEPLRAAKTPRPRRGRGHDRAPRAWCERVAAYGEELPALLIVASAELSPRDAPGRHRARRTRAPSATAAGCTCPT